MRKLQAMLVERDFKNFNLFLNEKTKTIPLTKIVLMVLALSSLPFVVAGGVALGNAVQIFKMFDKNKKYSERQFLSAVRTLRHNKLIHYTNNRQDIREISFTKLGHTTLKYLSLECLFIEKPFMWDGKWRVVMFDLPVRYSKVRHALRFRLKQLGFVQFQKSVWIYPYPCFDQIVFVAEYYKVTKYIDMFTVIEMTNDLKIKSAFNV